MPVKKPPTRFSGPSAVPRKRILYPILAIALLGAGTWFWYDWARSGEKNPQFHHVLFEKNDEQIRIGQGESLQTRPRDRLRILAIDTSIFRNQGVRLTCAGFDVNALLNDQLTIGALLPRNELPDRYRFKIEIKYYNRDIGSLELLVEPVAEDWLELTEKTIDKSQRILILEKALQLHPGDRLVRNRLTEEYRSQRKWPQLAKLLEELSKKQPAENDLRELAAVYENLKKQDETASALRRLLKLNPQDTAARVRLAALLEEQKKYGEAVAEYEILLKQGGPENQSAVYKTLGFLYTATGRTDEALAAFLKAVELDPKDVNLYYNLSDLYLKSGDAAQSDLMLAKALEIKGDDDETRLKLAERLLKKQKLEEAAKLLSAVLDKDPASLKALLLMAQVMDAGKDKAGLKDVYLKILDLDPANETIVYNLGVLEYERGDLSKARDYFAVFLKKHPQDAEAHSLLFEVLKKQNQDEPALKEALILAELKPADPGSYRFIFNLLNQRNRHAEMVPIMQKGIAKNPDQKELREYLILAYLKTGREEQAAGQIKELLQLKPKDVNLWLQLAALQEKREKYEEALESYQKVLDIDPDHAQAEEAYLRLKLQMLRSN